MTPKKKWTDRHGRPELTVHPDIIATPTDWRPVDEPTDETGDPVRSEPAAEQRERIAKKRRRAQRMAAGEDAAPNS